METTSVLLDYVETRVEELRNLARKLIDQQAEISNTLSVIDKNLDEEADKASGSFSEVDREDLKSRIVQLQSRLSSVHAEVKTVRDVQQAEALHKVNLVMDDLIQDIQTETCGTPENLRKAQIYLDAITIGTGTKFESLVLACSSDDQKTIKRKLEELIEHVNVLKAGSRGELTQ